MGQKVDFGNICMKDIAEKIAKFAKDAFVIIVTNSLDAMVWVLKKVEGSQLHSTYV